MSWVLVITMVALTAFPEGRHVTVVQVPFAQKVLCERARDDYHKAAAPSHRVVKGFAVCMKLVM